MQNGDQLEIETIMNVEFSILKTNEEEVFVASPQLFSFQNRRDQWVVHVWFMENAAASIVKGHAKPAMGKTILKCQYQFPSGAINASVKLFKVQYIFLDSQGLQTNFEFRGATEINR